MFETLVLLLLSTSESDLLFLGQPGNRLELRMGWTGQGKRALVGISSVYATNIAILRQPRDGFFRCAVVWMGLDENLDDVVGFRMVLA